VARFWYVVSIFVVVGLLSYVLRLFRSGPGNAAVQPSMHGNAFLPTLDDDNWRSTFPGICVVSILQKCYCPARSIRRGCELTRAASFFPLHLDYPNIMCNGFLTSYHVGSKRHYLVFSGFIGGLLHVHTLYDMNKSRSSHPILAATPYAWSLCVVLDVWSMAGVAWSLGQERFKRSNVQLLHAAVPKFAGPSAHGVSDPQQRVLGIGSSASVPRHRSLILRSFDC